MMWCLEIAECRGADVYTYPDYFTRFNTYEECKAYCDKENEKSTDSTYIQPHEMSDGDIKSLIKQEEYVNELFSRIY